MRTVIYNRLIHSAKFYRFNKLSNGLFSIRFQSTNHSSTLRETNTNFSNHNHTISCTSCGVNLQNHDPVQVGFYLEPKKDIKSKRRSKRNLQFVSALSKINDEGRKLLGMSTEIYNNLKEDDKIVEKPEELVCKRCHDALHHSIYNIDEHLPMKYQEVLDSIPKQANILQVFSAYDFPLSLVRVKSRNDVTYVMNKTDLLFGHGSTSRKYHDYFKTMIRRLTGEENNLMVISAYTNWGILDLFKKLDHINYLVGYVNAGKTRLCNRLINFARKIKDPTAKIKKPEGSSHLPALTRENIVHECLDKTVVDVPGFLNEDGIFKHLKPQYLKKILQGKKLLVADLKDKPYFTLKNQNCLSHGGIYFIIPPKDSILQVKTICQGESHIYKDLEKALDIVKSPPEALEKFVYVKPESMNEMVRYVIPPFLGTIDLIIKDVGYVQIKPTGAKKNDDLFEVWAPRGVELGVRETIEHFLTRYIKSIKTDEKVIKKKDSTMKTKKIQKMTMEPKKVPDYNIFSRLYEIPKESNNPREEMLIQYEQHLKDNKQTFHRWNSLETRDTSRNKYWIEKI